MMLSLSLTREGDLVRPQPTEAAKCKCDHLIGQIIHVMVLEGRISHHANE